MKSSYGINIYSEAELCMIPAYVDLLFGSIICMFLLFIFVFSFSSESVKFLKFLLWIFLKNPRTDNHQMLHESQLSVNKE